MSDPNNPPPITVPTGSSQSSSSGPLSPSVQSQTRVSTSTHIRNQQIDKHDALTIPFLSLSTSSPSHPNNKKPIVTLPLRNPTPHIPHYHFTPTQFNTPAPTHPSVDSSNPAMSTASSNPIPTTPLLPIVTPAPNPITPNTTAPPVSKKDKNHEIPPHMAQNPAAQAINPPMPDFAISNHPFAGLSTTSGSLANTSSSNPAPGTTSVPSTQARQDALDQVLEETRTRRLAEEDCQKTASIIASAIKLIRDRDVLLADGSNYRQWVRRLRELASQLLYNTVFFVKPSTNIHHEKIGRAGLLHSIDQSLEDGISSMATCHDGFKSLKLCFNSICCAAQISTLDTLLWVEPDSFATAAAYGARVRDLITDLKDLNVQFTEDNILGLLLQRNQRAGPTKHEMAQQVEHIIYTNPLQKVPSFNDLLKMYDVCRSQVAISESSNSQALFPDIQSPHHMIADMSSQTPDPDETTKPNGNAANAARPNNNNCHICRQPGHWSASCPDATLTLRLA
ncbi:hypothetical protein PTTG_06707 [Puccinia triticina 1-1 BBBD Race 1]|uniref:CCHC-type domain-containing protein n=1 Tax=Puccinia triticina (isolate 1-1 / race 1 (BBBD)) TaxID=630390 RepID=A0A180GMU8_PUCT1|nr:hypothetical protein PTTG_06707 [Puccinia triticina 1-1 BBBD Race 1]